MLEVFEPGALNYFTSSRPILLTLSVSRDPILTPLPLFGFSALRSDGNHSRTGILSLDATHASGCVIIFVRQGLSFSKLSTSSLSSLDPYSDYVGVNISLSNSSSFSFFNVYAPYLLLPNGWQNRLIFSLHSSLLQKSLHSGGLQLPSPLWDSRGTSNPRREEVFNWVISSDLFLLNDPDTPTLLQRSSGSFPLPTFPLLPPLLPFLAPGRCFRTLVLTIYQFFSPSLPLSPAFRPNECPLPSALRKLAGMTLPPTLTLTVLLQRNTCFFPLLLLS